MTRREANLEILRLIYEYVYANPEQRFTQILHNMFIVYENDKGGLRDEFYLESEDLLERVSKYL